MATVIITGAATGIGHLTAKALAHAGHTVWASMRDPDGSDRDHSTAMLAYGTEHGLDLRVIGLDVTSQGSADRAVAAVVDGSGRLDVVVHNAGHLHVGYVEAFTDEDIGNLLDVNAVGAHRLNRAALPHLREQRSGLLVYVGSTIVVHAPPFVGPYVASKAALDALAVVTSYEVAQFGIETSMVMPGAITQGTAHFPDASHASDTAVTAAYAPLDSLVARNEEATASLVRPGMDAGPQPIADEITRIVALPRGQKPFRTVIDSAQVGVDHVMAFADLTRTAAIERMGFGELLHLDD